MQLTRHRQRLVTEPSHLTQVDPRAAGVGASAASITRPLVAPRSTAANEPTPRISGTPAGLLTTDTFTRDRREIVGGEERLERVGCQPVLLPQFGEQGRTSVL